MNSVFALLLRVATFLAAIGSVPLSLICSLNAFIRKIGTQCVRVCTSALGIVIVAVKKVFKIVLYGFATALLVFSAYQLGFHEGTIQHQRRLVEMRAVAPLRLFDRNGTLLYSTTVGKFDTSTPLSKDYKRAPDFVSFALQALPKQFGATTLDNGAFITTTLDVKLQTAAQEAVLEQVISNTAEDGSVIIVNSQSGDILALVESIHYFDQPSASNAVKHDYSEITQQIQTKKLNPFLSFTDKNGKKIYAKKIEVNSDIDQTIFNSVSWSVNTPQITSVGNYLIETSLRVQHISN